MGCEGELTSKGKKGGHELPSGSEPEERNRPEKRVKQKNGIRTKTKGVKQP